MFSERSQCKRTNTIYSVLHKRTSLQNTEWKDRQQVYICNLINVNQCNVNQSTGKQRTDICISSLKQNRLPIQLLNTHWKQDTRFSAIAYTNTVMAHIKYNNNWAKTIHEELYNCNIQVSVGSGGWREKMERNGVSSILTVSKIENKNKMGGKFAKKKIVPARTYYA